LKAVASPLCKRQMLFGRFAGLAQFASGLVIDPNRLLTPLSL
jgi:hypothetical protein